MLLIFFLLNLALALSVAFVILSFKKIHLGYQIIDLCLQILEFLASLEFIFRLHFSCRFAKGASNSGLSPSSIGSHWPTGPGPPWGPM